MRNIRDGKQVKKETMHNHPYRRLIVCRLCERSLIGERQKGHVYYRCHTKGCPTTGIRQDVFEAAIAAELQRWRLMPADQKRYELKMKRWLEKRQPEADKQAINLQLANVAARLEKLTDALLDQLIDKQTFLERKDRLKEERASCEKQLREDERKPNQKAIAQKYLELTKNLVLSHGLANPAQKAEMLRIVLSNCTLAGKNLCLETQNWVREVEKTLSSLCGAPLRDRTRTMDQLQNAVDAINKIELAPDAQDAK